MKTNTINKTIALAVCASLALFTTACGKSGSKKSAKPVTTTLAVCPANPAYNPTTKKWYTAADFKTECSNAKPTTQGQCPAGQMNIRVPKAYAGASNTYGQPVNSQNFQAHAYVNVGVSAGSQIAYDYHTRSNEYTYTCVNQYDRHIWTYQGYYYYNTYALTQTVKTHSVDLELDPLSVGVGIVGTLIIQHLLK